MSDLSRMLAVQYAGERVTDSPKHLVQVKELDKVYSFEFRIDAITLGLGLAIESSLKISIHDQRLWSPEQLSIIKPARGEFHDLLISGYSSRPLVLFGRNAKNTIQREFFSKDPTRIEKVKEMFGLASNLKASRYHEAIYNDGHERKSYRGVPTRLGMQMQVMPRLQRQFKPLVNLYQNEAQDLINSYDGKSALVLDIYIGTGMFPRLYCDHTPGPTREACDECTCLFLMEWLIFAKHLRSEEELVCGLKAFGLNDAALKGEIVNLQEYVAQLGNEAKRGIKLGTRGILTICLYEFLEDLKLDEYLTQEKCNQDGAVDDIESLLQALELITDVIEIDELPNVEEELPSVEEGASSDNIRKKPDRRGQRKSKEPTDEEIRAAQLARVKAANEHWQMLMRNRR